MSMPFQLPALANPEALDTVAELREELHRANERLIVWHGRLMSLSDVAHGLSNVLGAMAAYHAQGDSQKVTEMLDVVLQNQRAHAAKS